MRQFRVAREIRNHFICYPVFGKNKLLAPGGSSYYYVTIRPWGLLEAGYECL